MLQIHKEIKDSLDFDLDEAVASFRADLQAHRSTIDVPAPTAHPLVEAVVASGGYNLIEPEAPPQPEIHRAEDDHPEVLPPASPEGLLAELEGLVEHGRQLVAQLSKKEK